MKDFVEKLIKRLEEYKYVHLVEHDKEMLEHCTENERTEHCDGIDCFWCVWDKSISIVNQLAEEYKPKTNADKIRSMSDEELAEFLEKIVSGDREVIGIDCKNYRCISWKCTECIGVWLKSEA